MYITDKSPPNHKKSMEQYLLSILHASHLQLPLTFHEALALDWGISYVYVR